MSEPEAGFTSPCGRYSITKRRGKWLVWRTVDEQTTPCGLSVVRKKGSSALGKFDTIEAAIGAVDSGWFDR